MDFFSEKIIFGGSKSLLYQVENSRLIILDQVVENNLMLGYITNIKFQSEDKLVVSTKQGGCFFITLNPYTKTKLYDTLDNKPWGENFAFNEIKTAILGKKNSKTLIYFNLFFKEGEKKFEKLSIKKNGPLHIQGIAPIREEIFAVSLGHEILITIRNKPLKKINFLIDNKICIVIFV